MWVVKMTETAIDTAGKIVKRERGKLPTSNLASMRTLGEMGVLARPLAEEMVQVPGSEMSYRIPTAT